MSVEPWLRGPVPGVAPELQPAAHALLNALADIEKILADGITDDELRARPGGAASIGFHLVHLAGAIDRLTTYAGGCALTSAQHDALRRETDRAVQDRLTVTDVAAHVRAAIDGALRTIRDTDPATVSEARGVGRAQLPSTVGGLLFHTAEHSARHAGQALTTFRIVRTTKAANA